MITRTIVLSLCMSSSLLAVMTTSAWAQTRQELELPPTPSESSSLDVNVQVNQDVRANCPFEGQALSTEISQIIFNTPGGSDIAPELREALANIATPVGVQPLSVVCDIRDSANQALRRGGWIATVQIPQQELKGDLRLNVISARISEIRIIGDPGPYRKLLEERLEQLQKLNPLNESDAERILFAVADVPGMDLRMALAPSGGLPGEVIGNLTVSYEPYAVFVNARNYNSKRIGRETVFGRFEYYGLTGLADTTSIGVQTTLDFKEQLIFQLGHEFGIGKRGLRIGADITFAPANPDVESLDFETDALLANLRIKYPLIRTSRQTADVTLGFDYIDQSTDVGSFPLSEDAIRALYLRGDVTGRKTRRGGGAALDYSGHVELRQGINIFGTTEIGDTGTAFTGDVPASRPFGRGDSFIATGGLQLSATLGPVLGVRARGEAQWTDDPLLNYDEYSLGNLSIGRGYDPGANSGDRAYGGAFEVNARVLQGARPSVQLFGFYDVVQIENLDFATLNPKRTLASYGGGLRMAINDNVSAEITYAKPLDRAIFSDNEKPSDRVLFSVTTKFSNGFW